MFPFIHNKHFSRAPWFTVNFDSSSGLACALANCLHHRGFPGVGTLPESELIAKLINAVPWKLKKNVYIKGSAKGNIDPANLSNVRTEVFNAWITGNYPKRKYPAIMIGSSSGPGVHLGAAMGIPWLPQTFLILVNTPKTHSVDEPIARMEWAKEPANALLNANPDLQLHHMMDPNQDRPMLQATSYFRVKQTRLGGTYEQFITQNLEESGTIYIINCQKKWPVTKVSDRHYFQFGGLGGTSIEEYHQGSENVRQFLQQAGATIDKWETPQTNCEMPEAEWGFAPELMEDITRLAKEKGYKIQELQFYEPEDASPYIADLYRWWYQLRGITVNQLLIGMFFLVEPFWTLCTGSIPFWMAFNAKGSVEVAMKYLKTTSPFDSIYLMPFNHGVQGQGLATVSDYQELFHFAQTKGDFIGTNPSLYPFDFGIYFRYEKDLKRKLTKRFPINEKLSLIQLEQFIQQNAGKYPLNWIKIS